MNGLDLFSGIGGLTRALEGYVRPVAYCERDLHAAANLLSEMHRGGLPLAPIWDDITTLNASLLPKGIDIIYGGFPCQDISVAGRGAGVAGERSGLFFEIARLIGEVRPRFVFLENVSAITIRGAERVVGELCRLGYDSRWGVLSASDVGANHRRDRWWLLAHANDQPGIPEHGEQQEDRPEVSRGSGAPGQPFVADTIRPRWLQSYRAEFQTDQPRRRRTDVAYATSRQDLERGSRSVDEAASGREGVDASARNGREDVANTADVGLEHGEQPTDQSGAERREGMATPRGSQILSDPTYKRNRRGIEQPASGEGSRDVADANDTGERQQPEQNKQTKPRPLGADWWATEPCVGRVANGIPKRVDRLRGLGNAVVSQCAREAFERLMGLK